MNYLGWDEKYIMKINIDFLLTHLILLTIWNWLIVKNLNYSEHINF